MNESNMPQEWWREQDEDEQWIKQQEEALQRFEQDSSTPLLADGFEAALIGYGQQFNQTIAIYDYARCVDVLERSGMTRLDAEEYMEYNVMGAYVGRATPVFLMERLDKRKSKAKKDKDTPTQLGLLLEDPA